MKLRIALVVSHPIQHFCPQYASFAANENIEFKVFFASMMGLKKYVDADFGKEISWGNLDMDKFDHEFLNGEQILPSGHSLDAPSLDEALKNFRPDAIIGYGYFQALQRRAHKWARKNKVPLAYIADSEHRQKRNKLKEIIKYPFLRWYFSGVSHFFTVGDANEAYYRHYGVKKGKFIRMHYSIDVKYYTECYNQRQALRSKIRDEYKISENEIVLSVAGKLVTWKNQEDIIDALAILEKEKIFLHLFILGSGPQMELLKTKTKNLSGSKVHFPGFVSIEQLPFYYSATDVYVHPASIEPHSIAISEAIFMHCPVIISDRCGSYGETDDVQEGKNGTVYPFGDISALAEKIKWMTISGKLRNEMGEFSHELGLRHQQRSHVDVMNDLVKHLKK